MAIQEGTGGDLNVGLTAPSGPEPPPQNAAKDEWVAWAREAGHPDPDNATKRELIEWAA